MTEKTNKNWIAMSDAAIIAAIGEFMKQKRLQENKTQAQLAKEAGLNRSTLVQIENGESVTLTSLIQILRVLNLLHLLDIFTIEDKMSPMEYVKMKEKKRLRARKKDTKTDENEDIGW
ncbi:MAG TPA: helix-turn-helix transcriptional regulator [Bacteroidales bacterium]|nr:helix-turn-helix transcriptional regulator [Bacteroidales bacterium]